MFGKGSVPFGAYTVPVTAVAAPLHVLPKVGPASPPNWPPPPESPARFGAPESAAPDPPSSEVWSWKPRGPLEPHATIARASADKPTICFDISAPWVGLLRRAP